MKDEVQKVDVFSIFILILVNAVPLYGVLVEHWSGVAVIALYLLETAIIGAFHALRMVFYLLFGVKPLSGKISVFIILFFLFHFFIFIIVQSGLFFGFASESFPGLKAGFDLLHNFGLFFQEPYVISIYFIVSAQVIYSLREMTTTHLFEKMKFNDYMFLPYSRVFIQQAVIILGAMVFLSTGNIMLVVVLLIIFKTVAEYMGMKYGVKWMSEKEDKIKTR